MQIVSPRFPLGRIVILSSAMREIPLTDRIDALIRHRSGDWGDASEEERLANENALIQGTRLQSTGRVPGVVKRGGWMAA